MFGRCSKALFLDISAFSVSTALQPTAPHGRARVSKPSDTVKLIESRCLGRCRSRHLFLIPMGIGVLLVPMLVPMLVLVLPLPALADGFEDQTLRRHSLSRSGSEIAQGEGVRPQREMVLTPSPSSRSTAPSGAAGGRREEAWPSLQPRGRLGDAAAGGIDASVSRMEEKIRRRAEKFEADRLEARRQREAQRRAAQARRARARARDGEQTVVDSGADAPGPGRARGEAEALPHPVTLFRTLIGREKDDGKRDGHPMTQAHNPIPAPQPPTVSRPDIPRPGVTPPGLAPAGRSGIRD